MEWQTPVRRPAAKRARTAAPVRPGGAPIDRLQSELLGRVFAAAGREAGPTVTLVCRRWHAAFFAEPALWSDLELARRKLAAGASVPNVQRFFGSKHALLRRVGASVQRLTYLERIETAIATVIRPLDYRHQLCANAASGLRLGADVLARLSPAALTSLELQLCLEIEPEALAALASLTGLQELTLICPDLPLPPGAADVFSGLRQLRALSLTAGSLPDGLLAAVPGQLQRLSLDAPGMPDGLVASLQRLTALTGLECRAHQLPAMRPLCTLTTLRHLGWLELQRPEGSLLRPPLQQMLAALPRLQSWTIGSTSGYGYGSMKLEGIVLYSCGATGRDHASSSVHGLSLIGVDGQPSLRAALEAALPAGTHPTSLRSLEVKGSRLAPEPLLCPHLANLTRLCLHSCRFFDAPPHPALGPAAPEAALAAAAVAQQMGPLLTGLLRQAPHVTDLDLSYSLRLSAAATWPQGMLDRRGILRLSLRGHGLHDLPAGPYLHDLESLDLDGNWFSSLPRALAGATALTCLSLRNNEELEFKLSDVEDVLAYLARLAELCVWGSGYSHYLHEGLQASLPQLTINALRPKRQELIPLAHQEMHLQ
ncbi:hypothetical protein COHA_009856 [Chlorella ohadii]|uniref:Uncharacterized protein n=1 Tax=Chlorella ohadii TaxID=2649997 RepID=A0AAD5DHH8_9CHLO|nr:hypothetical protein COHA_009856 [Chlorella ohadii]